MTAQDTRPIVVGVDGSPGSKAALAFALEEGLARGVTVEVVTSWILGPAIGDIAPTTTVQDEQRIAQECQEAALTEVLARFPTRPGISRLVLQSYGGHALVDAAHDAALLVVGSGRKGLMARALLGSVSEFCVRHASVPVVVVPDPSRLGSGPVWDPATDLVTAELVDRPMAEVVDGFAEAGTGSLEAAPRR